MAGNRMVHAFASAALAAMLAGSALARAQEPGTEPTRVAPGASTRVWIMAAWDDACRPLAPPRIEIVAAPAKGSVSFREGQATTVKTSTAGTCIGARVTGTGVYYTANAGAEGLDTFAIEARLANGEAAKRSFRMIVAE